MFPELTKTTLQARSYWYLRVRAGLPVRAHAPVGLSRESRLAQSVPLVSLVGGEPFVGHPLRERERVCQGSIPI